jgi:hypothetical protein
MSTSAIPRSRPDGDAPVHPLFERGRHGGPVRHPTGGSPTPAEAAAQAAIVAVAKANSASRLLSVASGWIERYGLIFAAEAAVELMGTVVVGGGGAPLRARRMFVGERRGHLWRPDPSMRVCLKVGAALARAGDDQYTRVIARLERFRTAHPYQRLATSMIATAMTTWVDEDCVMAAASNDDYQICALLPAVHTAEQLARISPLIHRHYATASMAVLDSLVDGAGEAVVPLLCEWLDSPADAEGSRRVLSVLSRLPGDAALRGLIARADLPDVRAVAFWAAEQDPQRALRLLSEAGRRSHGGDLLHDHLRRLTQVAPGADRATSPGDGLPVLLTAPPWSRPPASARPPVIAGLGFSDRPAMAWAEGERECWAHTEACWPASPAAETWQQLARRVLAGPARWDDSARLFAEGPEQVVRPLLAEWQFGDTWSAGTWLRRVAARFDVDALAVVADLARRDPAEAATVIGPFAAPVLAPIVAAWLTRNRVARQAALDWLGRHPTVAARALVPVALGKLDRESRAATRALCEVAAMGHDGFVRRAAQVHGTHVSAAIDALLDVDPLGILPARMPAMPEWASPAGLPPIRSRTDGSELDPEAVRNIIVALTLCRPGEPYAGVSVIQHACTPQSLAEFGWALFERWRKSGARRRHLWALHALSLIGNDETVARLTPLIASWSAHRGHARAVAGLQVLAAIGSRQALAAVHATAGRIRSAALRAAAEAVLAEFAAERGIGLDTLLDQMHPGSPSTAAGGEPWR